MTPDTSTQTVPAVLPGHLPAEARDKMGEILLRYQQALGVENYAVAAQHMDMLLTSIGTSDTARCTQAVEALAAVFAEMQPYDELERVLLLQVEMAAMRAATALRQSRAASSVESQNTYVNMATRLMRICAQQIETFTRYRNRNNNAGVTVNQITADNAIVGTVYNAAGGKRHADD